MVARSHELTSLVNARAQELTDSIIETSSQIADKIASSAEEVNSTLRTSGESLVLDLNLPDGDGLKLVESWREAKFNEPVLILSARHSLDDRLKGLNLGADDYLAKPFSLDELVARLRALAQEHGAAGDARVEFTVTGTPRPLGGYATLLSGYTAGVGVLGWAIRRRGALPERIPAGDLALLTVATHKLSRLVAKDSVTAIVRAPFTRFEESIGEGEVNEEVLGTGVRHAADVIPDPSTHWMLAPALAVIPLQLLAYHIAQARGLNVDQPRNLAKTVTVE